MSTTIRRSLFCVVGTSPAVVSETLFALAIPRDANTAPWIPDEIVCVTTTEGQRILESKLTGAEGWIAEMCRDYPDAGLSHLLEPHKIRVEIIHSDTGPLQDIRTPDDNIDAGESIFSILQSLTQDETSEVYVSLAGGRKTMSFLTGFAMSVLGRPSDRLLHVLLTPDGMETNRNFGFPPSAPRMDTLARFENGQRVEVEIDLSTVRVDLAEVPFVRIGDFIGKETLRNLRGYADAIEECKRISLQRGNRVEVVGDDSMDERSFVLRFRGKDLKLAPTQQKFFLYLLEHKHRSIETGFRPENDEAREHYVKWLGGELKGNIPLSERITKQDISVVISRIGAEIKEVFLPNEAELIGVQRNTTHLDKRYWLSDELDFVDLRGGKLSSHRPKYF